MQGRDLVESSFVTRLELLWHARQTTPWARLGMLFRCQGESESERLVDPGVGATIDADLQIRGGVLTHRRG